MAKKIDKFDGKPERVFTESEVKEVLALLIHRAVLIGHSSDCDGFGYQSADETGLFLCKKDKQHPCGLYEIVELAKYYNIALDPA